jgi:lysophospholipase L1-like esterase
MNRSRRKLRPLLGKHRPRDVRTSIWRKEFRVITRLRNAFLGLIGLLLILLLFEGAARAVTYLIGATRPHDLPDPRITLGVYRDQPWAATMWREQVASKTEYRQFEEWRWKPFRGQHVNMDSDGVRKTSNPDPPSAHTLHVFGGSTIWGRGARDDFTVPSWLSRKLSERGHPFRVVNHGVTAFITTQELVRLVVMLHRGERPDYVVFYDGANDVYSAYLSGRAGTIYDLAGIKRKVEQKEADQLRDGLTGLVRYVAEYVRLVGATVGAIRRVFPRAFLPYEVEGVKMDKDRFRGLARDIADEYRRFLDVLDHLAVAYGFRYAAFWQPILFTEKRLVGEERDLARVDGVTLIDGEKLGQLFREVAPLIVTDPSRHFYNISDVLDGRGEPCYIDFAHLSEACNALVAERIADIIVNDPWLTSALAETGAAPPSAVRHRAR